MPIISGVFFGVVSFREGNMDAPQLLLVVESQKWQCLCFLYVLFWAKTSSFCFYTKKHRPESRRPLFLCVFSGARASVWAAQDEE